MAMQRNMMVWAVSLFVCLAGLSLPVQAKVTAGDITGGKKAPHINIAIFHKLHGSNAFIYPKLIEKANIINAMADNAQFISINHTAGLKDGDVITIANDILRDAAGSFEDFGVDCQMTVRIKEEIITLAGVCQLLMVDQDHREIAHKGVIEPFQMDPSKAWTLIYYNDEDGIAVYADEEVGLE